MVFQKREADVQIKKEGWTKPGDQIKNQKADDKSNSDFMELMNGPAGAVGASLLIWVVFKTLRSNPDNDLKGSKFQPGSGQHKVFGKGV